MWNEVPEDWKPRLREHLRKTTGAERDRLSACDFRSDQSVHIRFEDGSLAMFRYAFAIFSEDLQRCMVFTEHCGYHQFPVGAASVEIRRSAPAG